MTYDLPIKIHVLLWILEVEESHTLKVLWALYLFSFAYFSTEIIKGIITSVKWDLNQNFIMNSSIYL